MTAGPPRHDLAGRVAVVTGGSRGIGEATAASLRRCGATVVVWDRDPPADRADSLAVDVASPASVASAVAETVSRHGEIGILVNSAGYAGPTMPVVDYPVEEWRRILDVNLTGTFLACRAAVPSMLRAGRGRIVNIASLAGKDGTPNASAYSAAKAGVLAFTKSLGKELARTELRVNAVAPAAIRTALLDQMSADHVRTMIDKSPMARLGEPEEVAELVLFLCSDACSFSTGAVFDLSGGRATY